MCNPISAHLCHLMSAGLFVPRDTKGKLPTQKREPRTSPSFKFPTKTGSTAVSDIPAAYQSPGWPLWGSKHSPSSAAFSAGRLMLCAPLQATEKKPTSMLGKPQPRPMVRFSKLHNPAPNPQMEASRLTQDCRSESLSDDQRPRQSRLSPSRWQKCVASRPHRGLQGRHQPRARRDVDREPESPPGVVNGQTSYYSSV